MAELFTIDNFCQVVIFVCSLGSVYLLSYRKNKWGNVVGLIQQPCWLYTTILHHQWVLVFSNVIFTALFILGIQRWFSDDRKEKLKQKEFAEAIFR